jgi:hypothetical protein
MPKQVTATRAKNNFGDLLEDVAVLGRVDIVRHGRLVAIVLSPLRGAATFEPAGRPQTTRQERAHMIPPALARAARMKRLPVDFDGD